MVLLQPITLCKEALLYQSIHQMDPAQPQPKVPPHLCLEHQKILHVWSTMNSLNLNPKKFLVAFLTNQHTKASTDVTFGTVGKTPSLKGLAKRTSSKGPLPEDLFRRTSSGGPLPEDLFRRISSGGSLNE
ncbi:hypothetical protein PCASD_26469 [Puccinia coronata f. sp. avenae]|uniref:Uncharacterized protein n=1 Tax=Puccinia coronata f. sp. avenae TaxID=200324 RepID=A0A2N5S5P8_9BASI|nr:hypothetical protein PCASD_26469 [Puccinia coronata f. sp. avenae]